MHSAYKCKASRALRATTVMQVDLFERKTRNVQFMKAYKAFFGKQHPVKAEKFVLALCNQEEQKKA